MTEQQPKRKRASRKKAHAFNVLSNVRCKYPGCEKFLKLRIVEGKQTAKLCYQHHKEVQFSRGHVMG